MSEWAHGNLCNQTDSSDCWAHRLLEYMQIHLEVPEPWITLSSKVVDRHQLFTGKKKSTGEKLLYSNNFKMRLYFSPQVYLFPYIFGKNICHEIIQLFIWGDKIILKLNIQANGETWTDQLQYKRQEILFQFPQRMGKTDWSILNNLWRFIYPYLVHLHYSSPKPKKLVQGRSVLSPDCRH